MMSIVNLHLTGNQIFSLVRILKNHSILISIHVCPTKREAIVTRVTLCRMPFK